MKLAAVRAMVQFILGMIGALSGAVAIAVDDPDDPDMLLFRVSTVNLNSAVARLRSLGGLGRYPEVFHALVLERTRRDLRSPPQDIRLTRAAFEALPPGVQRLLMLEPD